MDPLPDAAAASPLYTTPAEDALLGTTLFAMVEVAKAVFGIEGRVRLVRGMTLCFALVLAFGNALFGSETVPHLTGYLCWQTFLRALMTTFAAFGLNSVRDRGQQMQQAAMERRAIEEGGEGEAVAEMAAEAPRMPAERPEAPAAPDTAPGGGGVMDSLPPLPDPIPADKVVSYAVALVSMHGKTKDEALTLVLTDPDEARRLLADSYPEIRAEVDAATTAPAPAPAPAKPTTKAAALRAASAATTATEGEPNP